VTKLYVREAYREIFELVKFSTGIFPDRNRNSKVLLTGSPGTGKTA
jgi:DNA replication protein DnaC